jgi:hypothetical protein
VTSAYKKERGTKLQTLYLAVVFWVVSQSTRPQPILPPLHTLRTFNSAYMLERLYYRERGGQQAVDLPGYVWHILQ